jgi:FkbM family methyltransferase
LLHRLSPYAPVGLQLLREARWFHEHGEPEVRLVPAVVPRGGIALDVGANRGVWSYWLGRQVGRHGRVIAVEPLPRVASRLRRSASQLRLPVTVVCAAAGAEPGIAILQTPWLDGGRPTDAWSSLTPHCAPSARTTSQAVQVLTIDQIASDLARLDVMKIDVEGYERPALEGARHTITRLRPVLIVEIEARHSPTPITETFELIQSHGYDVTFLGVGGIEQPLAEFDVKVAQTPGASSYVNNFVARPHLATPGRLGTVSRPAD